MALIDLKYATIRLQSSTNHIDITIGEGNLEYSEKVSREYVKSRGELYTVRDGEEEPVEVSFQFVWLEIVPSHDGDPPTIDDVLKNINAASGWASTNPDPEAPFAIDINVTYQNTSCPGSVARTLFLQQFYYEELAHSLKDATVDCRGKCNITEVSYST